MDFTALMSNPKVQDMLMTAGLSILANNQPRIGQPAQSFGASLGQGLLAGTQYAEQQEDERQKDYWHNWDRGVQQARQDEDMRLKRVQSDATIQHMGNLDALSRENFGLQKQGQGFNQRLALENFGLQKQGQDFNQGLARDNFGLQKQGQDFNQGLARDNYNLNRNRTEKEIAFKEADSGLDKKNQAELEQYKPYLMSGINKLYSESRTQQPAAYTPEELYALSLSPNAEQLLKTMKNSQMVSVIMPNGAVAQVPSSVALNYYGKLQQGGGGDDLATALGETNTSPERAQMISAMRQRMAAIPPEQREEALKEAEARGVTRQELGW